MRRPKLSARGLAIRILLVLSLLTLAVPGAAQSGTTSTAPTVRPAAGVAKSRPVSEIANDPQPSMAQSLFREQPRGLMPAAAVSSGPDPVMQSTMAAAPGPTPIANFEGIGNRNGVAPPDPTGAAGRDQFVQAVNLSMRVYDKSGRHRDGVRRGRCAR